MTRERGTAITGLVVPVFDGVAIGLSYLLFDHSVVRAMFLAVVFAALRISDFSHVRLMPRVSQDAKAILVRLSLSLAVLLPWVLGTDDAGLLLETFAITTVFVLVGRIAAYTSLTFLRAKRVIAANTLIVGAGEVAQRLATTLEDHPEYGLRPVGFVEDGDRHAPGLPVLGGTDALVGLLRRMRVRRVIVAFGATGGAQMVRLLRACDPGNIELFHIPRFFELGVLHDSADYDDVWGIPLVRMRRAALRPGARVAKRTLDLAVTSVAIVLAAPIMLLIALAVRLTSRGPVLFRQERLGKDGRPIMVLKFRSMQVNTDSATQWSTVGDDRLTPIGRFIRATSFDELPQLFNVLRGDMSLVGPRPERPFFVDRFSAEVPGYVDRHRVPVGLTGWAQVHGLRGDTSIEERARFDNYYVENWSLWLDVVILARTVRALATGR